MDIDFSFDDPLSINVAGDRSLVVFGLGARLQTEMMMKERMTFDKYTPSGIVLFCWISNNVFAIASYHSKEEKDNAYTQFSNSPNDGLWVVPAFPFILVKIKRIDQWLEAEGKWGETKNGGPNSKITDHGGVPLTPQTRIDGSIFDTWHLTHPRVRTNPRSGTRPRKVVVRGDHSVLLSGISQQLPHVRMNNEVGYLGRTKSTVKTREAPQVLCLVWPNDG